MLKRSLAYVHICFAVLAILFAMRALALDPKDCRDAAIWILADTYRMLSGPKERATKALSEIDSKGGLNSLLETRLLNFCRVGDAENRKCFRQQRCGDTTLQDWINLDPAAYGRAVDIVEGNRRAKEKAATLPTIEKAATPPTIEKAATPPTIVESRPETASRPATSDRNDSSPSVDQYMNERIKDIRCRKFNICR